MVVTTMTNAAGRSGRAGPPGGAAGRGHRARPGWRRAGRGHRAERPGGATGRSGRARPGWRRAGRSGRHGGMASEVARYWQHAEVPGVDLLRARFVTHAYTRHAHETYTFALIEFGVEEFEYGGSLLRAGQGGV